MTITKEQVEALRAAYDAQDGIVLAGFHALCDFALYAIEEARPVAKYERYIDELGKECGHIIAITAKQIEPGTLLYDHPAAPSAAVPGASEDERVAIEFYTKNPGAALFDMRARIAAPTSPPAVADGREDSADRMAYEGAREDLLDWKRRALAAEDLNRKFVRAINEENGPTFIGEPVLRAAPPSVESQEKPS